MWFGKVVCFHSQFFNSCCQHTRPPLKLKANLLSALASTFIFLPSLCMYKSYRDHTIFGTLWIILWWVCGSSKSTIIHAQYLLGLDVSPWVANHLYNLGAPYKFLAASCNNHLVHIFSFSKWGRMIKNHVKTYNMLLKIWVQIHNIVAHGFHMDAHSYILVTMWLPSNAPMHLGSHCSLWIVVMILCNLLLVGQEITCPYILTITGWQSIEYHEW